MAEERGKPDNKVIRFDSYLKDRNKQDIYIFNE